jgi:glycosyltransferase involved in cell wall biosynthesis
MLSKLKIALVSYRYSVEISPTLKSICAYLHDQGAALIDVFVEDLYREKDFRLDGARIINAKERMPLESLLSRVFNLNTLFIQFLRFYIKRYDYIFCVDFQSLVAVSRTGADLRKVIFLSMEGTDFIRDSRYTKEEAAELLSRCALCIVQSKERGELLSGYLGVELSFEYLPAALRPVTLDSDMSQNPPLKAIYSGYIAEWACVLELLDAFEKSDAHEIAELHIHGHYMGTDPYLETVKRQVQKTRGVTMETTYYPDELYLKLLAQNHVGLALYRDMLGTGNFTSMILSSGKISAYLWCGLAVLTNIPGPETLEPPFVCIQEISAAELKRGLELIQSNLKVFREAARDRAANDYNFDRYMERIVKRLGWAA